ncbi:hypothetical protein ACIRS1_03080 [Kitasatospora sp. NPDC101176]|uniref:hypothetical protein n=1 Tax=Kitasatospora sp. NPDC101176 TaxID=3364099 RepID=UPI003803E85F
MNRPGYGFPQQAPGPVAGAGTPAPGASPGFGPPTGLLPPAPGGLLPGAAAPGHPTPGRPGGNLRRNTVWAFVGALLASAGWATAVLVVPGVVSTDSSPRSVSAYQVSDDFCTTGKPSSLLTTYSASDTSPPTHHSDRHPALDSMNCSMSLKRTGASSSDTDYASVYLRADLHKAVNPAPEFAAAKEVYRARDYQVTDVPGIGEEAYFLYKDDAGSSDKTWHSISAEVDVRDGGMTFYISYSASYTEGKGKVPSRDDLRSALQTDARNAVRSMHK